MLWIGWREETLNDNRHLKTQLPRWQFLWHEATIISVETDDGPYDQLTTKCGEIPQGQVIRFEGPRPPGTLCPNCRSSKVIHFPVRS